jgi:hypothetical protein
MEEKTQRAINAEYDKKWGSDKMKLNEPMIIALVRDHVRRKGWTLEPEKSISAQGPDIEASRPAGSQYRYLLIDAKGEMKSPQARAMGFRTLLGQIVSRMEKIDRREYRETPYYHEYGIALPAAYQSQLRKIARGMADMWRVMRLRVYLVSSSGRVEERNWHDFLIE